MLSAGFVETALFLTVTVSFSVRSDTISARPAKIENTCHSKLLPTRASACKTPVLQNRSYACRSHCAAQQSQVHASKRLVLTHKVARIEKNERNTLNVPLLDRSGRGLTSTVTNMTPIAKIHHENPMVLELRRTVTAKAGRTQIQMQGKFERDPHWAKTETNVSKLQMITTD